MRSLCHSTPQGREEVLNTLQDTHPGIVKMKSLARSNVWWPQMDTNLEEKVKSCAVHHYSLGNGRAALGRDCT